MYSFGNGPNYLSLPLPPSKKSPKMGGIHKVCKTVGWGEGNINIQPKKQLRVQNICICEETDYKIQLVKKSQKNSARGLPPLLEQCTTENIFSLLRCSPFVRCKRQVLIYSMCRSFPKLSAYDKKDFMTLNMKAINQYTLVTHYVALQNPKTLPCLLHLCLQQK